MALCFLTVPNALAQPLADSLRQEMAHASSPKEYARLLNLLAEETRAQQIDSLPGWADRLMQIGETLGDPGIQADAHTHLAWLNRTWGNDEQGMRHAEQALALADEAHDLTRRANVLYILGVIQREQGRMAEARATIQQAVKLYHADGKVNREARSLNAIGEIFRMNGDLDSALYFYRLAEIQFGRVSYQMGLLMVRNNRGLILNAQKQYQAAIDTLLPVNAMACDVGFEAIYFESANALANAYLSLNELDEARRYAKLAYSRSYQLGYKTYTRDAAYTLYNVFLALKDYQMALCYLMQHYEFANDIVNEASQNHIRSLSYDLQLKDKEGEIALLVKDKQIRQLYVVLGAIGLGLMLVIGLILYYFYRRKRRDNRLLERQNETLAALVQEKNGLINVVAHDLKSPLHKSKALLELLQGGDLSPQQARAVAMIARTLDDGERLIRDLLDISQAEDNKMTLSVEELDLAQLLEQNIAGHRETAAKKRITLEFVDSGTPLPLTTDASCITRILDNLLSNAIKYSPTNSTVVVACGQSEGRAWFSVKDQGPGFSPEDQEKMYRKFQRLSARPTGGESSNGLGLAIIKLLLTQVGGEIVLHSSPGQGAEFVVRLA